MMMMMFYVTHAASTVHTSRINYMVSDKNYITLTKFCAKKIVTFKLKAIKLQ